MQNLINDDLDLSSFDGETDNEFDNENKSGNDVKNLLNFKKML